MPSNRDQRKVVHTSCRRRFPHPYCFVRVGGIDYQVPIPNRSGWSPNAPPRKGINWCPSPRMKGETAELSKLMQSKREEKTTSKASVSKILRINLLRLFVALACAALNLRNKQLSILVALSAANALIAAFIEIS